MEIHFQTTDHVVAVEKVAEQHIRTKYCKCNSFRVISHIIILAKIAITHSKVGQTSPNPKNIEEQKNSLGLVIYQKCITVVVSEKLRDTRTHARTHAHGANYDLPPASRAGDNDVMPKADIGKSKNNMATHTSNISLVTISANYFSFCFCKMLQFISMCMYLIFRKINLFHWMLV